jgi:dipeptidyl aminopeptidase/acylaminoacyl peptidase
MILFSCRAALCGTMARVADGRAAGATAERHTRQRRRLIVTPRLTKLCGVISLFLLLGNGVAGQDPSVAKTSIDRLMDALVATRGLAHVTISPDGKSVAWVQSEKTKADGPRQSAVYVAELAAATGKPRRISAGDKSRAEHSPAWSPDGKRLAFLAKPEKDGPVQLYVASIAGNDSRRLTNVKGLLAAPRWSPDGSQIAVFHTEGASGPIGPTKAAEPELGEVGEHAPAQRLTILDAESGEARATSPAGLHIHEYDWSPDGKDLAAIASPAPGDSNWYIARLYAVSAASGEVREIYKPNMQIAVPRWSPDGKAIAFIGGLMSDEGANGGDIFTVPTSGGEPRNLTQNMKASASWLTWLPSGRVLFAEHVDGGSGLATVDVAGRQMTTLWTGPESISAEGGSPAVSLSRDGKISALVRQSFQRPPEVWAGPIGEWKQLTQANGQMKPAWGEAKSLHWKSDEWNVQGWLLYPRDYDPKRRYPLVVSVHGGPASARRPAWPRSFFDLTLLAHEGYFVLFPNPRGSYGQGEAFTRANVKDFGHGDLRDILAGVDAVLQTAPIDEKRIGIAGWSYGGYMTMWAVTQTNRFRTAVSGAGIANWQSYYGQNGIDQWLLPYFGASVYDDPAVYARCSPIKYIKQVRTPTLVLVGERDAECPVPQSREFWHALRTLKVPTQLVVYPGEGHGFSSPAHQRDVMRRTVGWLDKSLKASSQRDAQPSKEGRQSRSPYPPSPVIAGITWHWETHRTAAPGSDLWPVTWGLDDNLYTAWGDGGGFGGTDQDGRVALGFGRIEGMAERFTGININGGQDPVHAASFPTQGKVGGILAVGDRLYAWLNTQNGKWPDVDQALIWSDDKAGDWTRSNWVFPKGQGNLKPATFLNFGKGYTGIPSNLLGFVYFYGQKQGEEKETYLGRAPVNKVLDRRAYEFLAGFEEDKPLWSSDVSRSYPVFADANRTGDLASVVYVPALKRYLLTCYHKGPGQLGVFDAPQPWGPWTTVAYYEPWGRMGTEGEGLICSFPQKWMSADGLTLWCVFSAYGSGAKQGIDAHDKFNLVKASLNLRP